MSAVLSAPAAPPVPLLGCVTGCAKEVVRNIGRAAISRELQRFLLEVYARSFGDAGYQRRAGRADPGGSCPFDNAAFARELDLPRQHVYRLRVRAVELGMLFYDADMSDPSRGWLRWNLSFDRWQPLDDAYRRTRYARPGAGCPPGKKKSNGLRSPADEQIKRVTLGRLEGPSEAARDGALRKGTEERDTEEPDANASGRLASADATLCPLPAAHAQKAKINRPRKLTDEQLEAHQLEQQWCREALGELARRLDVKTVPRVGQQKAAAKWLYRELREVDDGQRRLWQCYDLTKRTPFWQGKTLLLSDLVRPFPEYRRDPAGYRAAIERECEAMKQREGEGGARYGHSGSGTDRRRAGAGRRGPGNSAGGSGNGRYVYTGGNGYERPGGPKFGTPEYYEDGRRRMAEEAARANAGLAG